MRCVSDEEEGGEGRLIAVKDFFFLFLRIGVDIPVVAQR